MFVLGVASRWEGERGGGGHAVRCRIGTELEQIGIIYSKRIFLAHIITNSSVDDLVQ